MLPEQNRRTASDAYSRQSGTNNVFDDNERWLRSRRFARSVNWQELHERRRIEERSRGCLYGNFFGDLPRVKASSLRRAPPDAADCVSHEFDA
jgi:hypothetical protein